jgi:hypothetical protein
MAVKSTQAPFNVAALKNTHATNTQRNVSAHGTMLNDFELAQNGRGHSLRKA